MTHSSGEQRTQDAVLICGPWPHPGNAIFKVMHGLIAFLHQSGRSVAVLCEGYAFKVLLGPEAVCLVEIPRDQPFDWETAFSRKLVAQDLARLLACDRGRRDSLLARVGVIQALEDQLIFSSDHPSHSRNFERLLSDYHFERAGQRPRLVRTRNDDVQGNLDGFMRLTGIDFVALDREDRLKFLRGEVDLRPIVAEHVRCNREVMTSWGWTERFIDEAIHHAWWRIHQLYRWRHELTTFDSVVCLSTRDRENNRELLLGDARKLAVIHVGTSFDPASRARVDGLLYDYHHHQGLHCFRADGDSREAIPFTGKEKKIVFVGRAQDLKGIFELADSVRTLYHSGRFDVRGIFVGGFGQELRRKLAASDRAAREYLLFTGPIYDIDVLASVYAFGDVTAIPSFYDPFPLVGQESYRMGTPCVVTEGTGASEAYYERPRRQGVEMALPVRRRRQAGIERFSRVDVESLAVQLAFLIDHPQTAWQMACAGEQFVRTQYSPERMGQKYLELYDHLVRGEPANPSGG